MDFLTSLCSVPTAPFVEWRVTRWVERFVKARPALRLSSDKYGNLLVSLAGRKKNLPRWVFTAHMDHPGMVATGMSAKGNLKAAFYGGVLGEYLPGAVVRFFDGDREIGGTITRVSAVDPERKIYPAGVEIK